MTEAEARAGTPMSDASGASEGDTADDLLARLLQCDGQLAELLETASKAVCALAPDGQNSQDASETDTFETHAQHWLTTLNLTLRESAHALREARLPPLTPPAAALARLSGEAGVAGPAHALSAQTPWSLSTLRLRANAWYHVVTALRAAAQSPSADSRALAAALGNGAAVRSRSV